MDSYLSPCGEMYNDNKLIYDKGIYDQLQAAGWSNASLPSNVHVTFETLMVV